MMALLSSKRQKPPQQQLLHDICCCGLGVTVQMLLMLAVAHGSYTVAKSYA